MDKKINLSDPTIQIRILKALEDKKPIGVFKNFYMVGVFRKLKQPNVINLKHIWQYLETQFDMKKYDERADIIFKDKQSFFSEIFDE